jgi:ribosomal protein L11 methyltransferase
MEDGRTLLRIYLDSPGQATAAVAALERLLGRSGLDPGECGIRVEAVADGRWAERYQASLQPFGIGSRFEVHPAGAVSGNGELLPLLLIPGRAFGTGEHATTRLCAAMLERHVRRGSRWLDLGCGTALLAMIAHHCGASRLLALDNDPEAIEVAEAVLDANRLSNEIELRLGSLDECPDSAWDGIVVNISGFFSSPATDLLYSSLAPGGILIASGFSREEAGEIEGRFLQAGFRSGGIMSEQDWAMIVASKPEEPTR